MFHLLYLCKLKLILDKNEPILIFIEFFKNFMFKTLFSCRLKYALEKNRIKSSIPY